MLKKTFSLTLNLALILTTSSCSLFRESLPDDWNYGILQPRPLTGIRNFPSTKTEYGKGFKDGCSSAFDASGKGLMADYNSYKYNYQRMKQGPDYQAGWWDGFEQCTYIFDHDVV